MTAPANLMSCPVCAADSPKWIDLDHLRTRDPWIEQERIGLDDPLGWCLCGHCGKLPFWSLDAADRIRPECRRAQETRDAQYSRRALPCRSHAD